VESRSRGKAGVGFTVIRHASKARHALYWRRVFLILFGIGVFALIAYGLCAR
jgi:hypothetical protein